MAYYSPAHCVTAIVYDNHCFTSKSNSILLLQTVYYYEKSVKCSYKAMEDTEQQLNTSLPGIDFLTHIRTICVSWIGNARIDCCQ